jgi:tRNA-dihydrouridine synthase
LRKLEGEDPGPEPAPTDRVKGLLRHLKLNWDYKGAWGLAEMRKQSMWYLKGLPWASETRNAINKTLELPEIEGILQSYLLRLETWDGKESEAQLVAEAV